MNTREERLKLLKDKRDRIEDRTRKVFIFKQRVLKTLTKVPFLFPGAK